ncbi:DUF748 domain-containing protein [Streptomyces bathyalis]|uniref:DUF748 domain-containing protein n=1 Tax=Streptomyces bathyalis TaxID=2710756 RepID=A0A7T1T2S3_9ACTN|nr:hypothetical protein [Streptomyces bathyalis]QPP05332.1 DUF748 domain-containing protein [Streptomyces bathyalis]
MHTGVKITAFVAALAASFGAAYGVGKVVDPVTSPAKPAAHGGHPGGAAKADGAGGDAPAGGLQVSEGGYTLDLETRQLEADKKADLRFVIRDSKGKKVTGFKREHDKELHLILASRDLTTFRHLHPTRAADGTWSISAELPKAGDYRMFADFTPKAKDAENLTLGVDLPVAGDYEPGEPAEESRSSEVDGYKVTLDGRLRPGAAEEVKLKVTKKGRPVKDLQPYLGAYGHLVALRGGDLAYLHVHPNGEPGDGTTKPGPEISFTATAPSEGTYRLFLDFKHEGKVRTAEFTVAAGPDGDSPKKEEPAEHGDGDSHKH